MGDNQLGLMKVDTIDTMVDTIDTMHRINECHYRKSWRR